MEKNERLFADIVESNKSAIYSVCYMFAKNADEADDLFQEVLINLWKGMGNFREESKVSTWIWRVSFNTCISADRKRKRNKSVHLSMDINLYDTHDEDSRQIKMLHDRIHRLKPFDRAIVMLWLEGMPYDEIAAVVGISVKNVSVRLVRIKEELKKMNNND
ncbi:sigma-70 family RNA polymerase sigma factor [Prevotella sp. PINT]|jgi:RNA polymerase sigma factor, sigma-70 family|uniref:RNA polymerase sigma factor n=1 Tax=Palleniella intestinalis TaxID=2736291 RepID=UPI001554CC3D|nr:sigma-70 family RNA polymerase sigma factor [Palleniella intestinalis]NPD81179.1 sigma-70 family RNA polymerase sigma factor [Palleniella intestinalis]